MAIALRATTNFNQATGTTIAVNQPTGTVDNDVVLVVIISDTGGVMSLAGWTSLSATNQGFMRATVLRRVASGEGASWTFNCSAGNAFTIIAVSYSGVDTTTPEDVASAATAASASPVTSPTITTVTDNAWRIHFGTTGGSQTTLVIPAGYTNDAPIAGAGGDLARVDHKVITPAGATGTATSTTEAGDNVGVSVVLRPIVAAAPDGRYLQESGGVVDRFWTEDGLGVLVLESDTGALHGNDVIAPPYAVRESVN